MSVIFYHPARVRSGYRIITLWSFVARLAIMRRWFASSLYSRHNLTATSEAEGCGLNKRSHKRGKLTQASNSEWGLLFGKEPSEPSLINLPITFQIIKRNVKSISTWAARDLSRNDDLVFRPKISGKSIGPQFLISVVNFLINIFIRISNIWLIKQI